MSSNQTTKVPAYLPYQKQFTPYKWYKPLLATLVALGFFLVFSTVLTVIGGIIAQNQGYDLQKLLMGGYDTLDAYTPLGAILTLGGVAIMLPAVFSATRSSMPVRFRRYLLRAAVLILRCSSSVLSPVW